MDPENLRRSSPPTRRESDALCSKRYSWTMVVIAHSVGDNCLWVLTALPFVTALMLNSCAHSRPVWDYYNQCAQENPSFLAMGALRETEAPFRVRSQQQLFIRRYCIHALRRHVSTFS